MIAPWVVEETKTAALNDKRLNDRLQVILSQLSGRPTASIPAACGGCAETAAAYRFFDNDKVDFDGVLGPHRDATAVRIAAQPTVLLVADTTEIDLTRPHRQVDGAGPLDGSSRRGLFLHPLIAFTPDGTPLGTVEATTWARDEGKPSVASRTRAERAATPIEEKESYRWLASMRRAREEASRHPGTRIVFVADSEADIYEVIAEGMAEPRTADWIVRACQDRALLGGGGGDEAAADHLRGEVLKAPALFTRAIKVRGREVRYACEDRGRRQPRKSRTAEVEVRAAAVTLRPPWRSDRELPAVTVNVVLVSEVDPPGDDVPVEWLLITGLPIDEAERVRAVIEYYCMRWMVEISHPDYPSSCSLYHGSWAA